MPPYDDWISLPVVSDSVPLTYVCTAKPMVGSTPLDDDHPLRVSWRVPPAVDPFYVDFMTRTPVEATFESSDLIRRLMPPATRQRTLAAFETQRRIDLIEARRLTGVRTSLTDLDAVLASAAPRPSVLALFITSEPEIHAARRALARGVDHPTVRQALAIDAIADRDYLRAVSEFEAAGPPSDGLERRLRALMLGLAGRKAEVLAMLGAESRTDAADRAERDWLAQRFGGSLPPPSPER